MEPWIQTYTGKVFRFDDISHDQFSIEDIAHALSNICRYTGHVERFYSVAEHSVLAWRYANPNHRRSALLHDISEAYLSDISAPLKSILSGYRELEHKIMLEASEIYDFEYPLSKEVKDIDLRLLQTERLQLLGKEPMSWGLDGIEPINHIIECWNPFRAKQTFLDICRREGIK